MEYTPLAIMLLDTGKIAFVIGLLVYLIRKMLSKQYVELVDARPFGTNIFIIFGSVLLALLGGWLNAFTFQPREIVEYIYFGLFSAGINTLGYEFIKNWAKELVRVREINNS